MPNRATAALVLDAVIRTYGNRVAQVHLRTDEHGELTANVRLRPDTSHVAIILRVDLEQP